jgi:hypothetical protein
MHDDGWLLERINVYGLYENGRSLGLLTVNSGKRMLLRSDFAFVESEKLIKRTSLLLYDM